MKSAVFDSNVLIGYTRDEPRAVNAVLDCPQRYISLITWIEFLVGFERSEQDFYKTFLRNNFDVLPCDADISELALDIRKTMKLKLADAIVYATAKFLRTVLVTFDKGDFNKNWPDVFIPE